MLIGRLFQVSGNSSSSVSGLIVLFFSAECNSLWPALRLLFQKCDILHVNYILLKRKSPSNTLRRTLLMTGCMFGPSKPRTNQVPGIKHPATLCITDAFEHFANPESTQGPQGSKFIGRAGSDVPKASLSCSAVCSVCWWALCKSWFCQRSLTVKREFCLPTTAKFISL